MIQFTMFGFSTAEIVSRGLTAVTVFGHCVLKRPTLAERLVQVRRNEQASPSRIDTLLGRDRSVVFSLFAVTEIMAPTLVEEYASIRNLLHSGELSREDCQASLEALAVSDDLELSRFTLFASCLMERPSAKEERKSLETAEGLGVISTAVRKQLAEGIGAAESSLCRILARAALA